MLNHWSKQSQCQLRSSIMIDGRPKLAAAFAASALRWYIWAAATRSILERAAYIYDHHEA